jgi:hypothetical protein
MEECECTSRDDTAVKGGGPTVFPSSHAEATIINTVTNAIATTYTVNRRGDTSLAGGFNPKSYIIISLA